MCTRCVPANSLTVSEAAAELKVSRQAILARMNVSSLPARQMSSGWVIPTGRASSEGNASELISRRQRTGVPQREPAESATGIAIELREG